MRIQKSKSLTRMESSWLVGGMANQVNEWKRLLIRLSTAKSNSGLKEAYA